MTQRATVIRMAVSNHWLEGSIAGKQGHDVTLRGKFTARHLYFLIKINITGLGQAEAIAVDAIHHQLLFLQGEQGRINQLRQSVMPQGPHQHFAAGAQIAVIVERRQGTNGGYDLLRQRVAIAQTMEYFAQLNPRPPPGPPKQPRSEGLFDIDGQIVQQIGYLSVIFC